MRSSRWAWVLFVGLPLFAASASVGAEDLPRTSCVACHGDADFFDEESVRMVTDFAADVHAAVGLSCHDCHGGNPDPELAEDLDGAKDEAWEAGPFRGAPGRADVPGFCGSCHSDPGYMRRFRPDARVDQEVEFWTSQHGVALAAGDQSAATCVDCHGTHGIQGPDSTDSLVHPTRVASTCGSCHSDSERMAGRMLPDGRPLRTDQQALWRRSVHAAAMYEREDLSAPTCNDCHGNHGAAPPGLESVTFVCGQCHGREAELFRSSPKHAGFELHNELLADAGEDGCAACHDPVPEGAAEITFLSECASCHGNHGVVRPTMGMYAALPETPCAFCHESAELQMAEGEDSHERFEQTRDALLRQAEDEGLEGTAVYDFLVDRSVELPMHSLTGEAAGEGPPVLQPEFARLFEKFRIGKTYYVYDDPAGGDEVRLEIVRCSTCHAVDGATEDLATGAAGGALLIQRMRELATVTSAAERMLLRARRGGVETREAQAEIDMAVDAHIDLQVLAHTFSTADDGAFMTSFEEGREHALEALEIGQGALDELAFRRRGLVVALAIIVLVLVALGLKIRQISRLEADAR